MAKKKASRQRGGQAARTHDYADVAANVNPKSRLSPTHEGAPDYASSSDTRPDDRSNLAIALVGSSSAESNSAANDEAVKMGAASSCEIERLRESLGVRFEELLRLTRMYQSLEAANHEASRSLEDALVLLAEQRDVIARLEKELAARTSERLDFEKTNDVLNECFRTAVMRTHTPEISKKIKGPVPRRRRLKSMKASTEWSLLSQSWLFDGEWYLLRYPDVAQAEWDPIEHYLRFGAKELRDPGPCFSTSSYLADNPDVAEAGVNALHHYLKYGTHEKRRVRPVKN